MQTTVKWFKTYEDREAYFTQNVSGFIPPSHLGAGRFWRAFSAVTPKDITAFNQSKTACITAFPQDSLAFAASLQILRAAAMGQNEALEREARAVELFGLAPLLGQALRTLSGGETVRLALAKVWLNAPTHRRLIIASPYSWLDAGNAGLTETVSQTYLSMGKPVTYLALNGEDHAGALDLPAAPAENANHNPLYFSIRALNLRLKLNTGLGLGDRPLWANAGDFTLNLASPCLVTGQNGAGKSLFVKALAKVNAYKGELAVVSGANQGPCRLLQQNTLAQSLFRTGKQFAPLSRGAVYDEFMDIWQKLRLNAASKLKAEIDDDSVLGLKLLLAATHLCQNPKLIIIDEPEWGLSLNAATAFVAALWNAAHAKGVPLIIVSHKSWWQNLAQSQICIAKTPPNAAAATNTAFNMHLKAV